MSRTERLTVAAEGRQLRPARAVRRVVTFHVGSLGDTLVALPAFWSVREAFPDAHSVMLTKSPARASIPVGRDILEGSGLFDEYLRFDGDGSGDGRGRITERWRKWWSALSVVWKLRVRRFDLAVYLAPSVRDAGQLRRDLMFFKLAGVGEVIGAKVLPDGGQGVPVLEAARLLSRLEGSRIPTRALDTARRDLALTADDRQRLARWLATQAQPAESGSIWVAFACGSNMQSKLWPIEHFAAVGRALIDQFDIWPVVVGGSEDTSAARELVRLWGRGLAAAGALRVRDSAALLERCGLFIGNDTGTMHLAAASGVPCVALFSARDTPGKWEPMGARNIVLRKNVPCAGCMLTTCEERDRLCLRLIEVDEVIDAARSILTGRDAWRSSL